MERRESALVQRSRYRAEMTGGVHQPETHDAAGKERHATDGEIAQLLFQRGAGLLSFRLACAKVFRGDHNLNQCGCFARRPRRFGVEIRGQLRQRCQRVLSRRAVIGFA